MLRHHNPSPPGAASRRQYIGASGFVGAAIVKKLVGSGVPVVPLTRRELDLEAPDAADNWPAASRA